MAAKGVATRYENLAGAHSLVMILGADQRPSAMYWMLLVVRNRPETQETVSDNDRPSGRETSLGTGSTKVLRDKAAEELKMWDGKTLDEIDPEVLLKALSTYFGKRKVKNFKADGKEILESREREIIKRSLISTLNQVESAEARQSIFNSVAADLGLTVPQPSESRANVVADNLSPPIPDKAPEIYRERSNTSETAEQFLGRAYEPWLASGSLFQFHIGKLDPSLLQGLKNQFKGRADELRSLLPPKKVEVSQRLAALVGREIDDPAQRRILAQAERSMSHVIKKLKM